EDKCNICFMENSLAQIGDPWLSSLKIKTCSYEKEVYHVFFQSDINENKIEENISKVKSIPMFIGALISPSNELFTNISIVNVIDQEIFVELTKGIKKIFIGAYDGEWYLLWSKV